MKFYRVHVLIEHGSSNGFIWATSKAGVAQAIADYRKNLPDESAGGAPSVEEVDIKPSKAGILHALNLYASHERNG